MGNTARCVEARLCNVHRFAARRARRSETGLHRDRHGTDIAGKIDDLNGHVIHAVGQRVRHGYGVLPLVVDEIEADRPGYAAGEQEYFVAHDFLLFFTKNQMVQIEKELPVILDSQ